MLGLVRERRREGGEDPVARLDEQDPALGRVDRAEVPAQGVAGELGDLPRHLDPGRPGADDDEGQQRLAVLVVGLDLGVLEGREDPPRGCRPRSRAT